MSQINYGNMQSSDGDKVIFAHHPVDISLAMPTTGRLRRLYQNLEVRAIDFKFNDNNDRLAYSINSQYYDSETNCFCVKINFLCKGDFYCRSASLRRIFFSSARFNFMLEAVPIQLVIVNKYVDAQLTQFSVMNKDQFEGLLGYAPSTVD